MSEEITKKDLKEFYNKLADKPLDPSDPFYVPFLEQGSDHGDPITELFTRIDWSEAASVNLLSGQRGSGKSTELRRLKKKLEEAGCVVFLCDMRDYMNLTTPVEITDFLISIMGALSKEVENEYGENPAAMGYWERLIKFMTTDVKIENIKFETNVAPFKSGITASLKDDPNFKTYLQKGLRGHVAKLVNQSHKFAADVVEFARKKSNDPDKKVVLLVDSVEQIRGVGADAEDVYRSVENLFSGHSDSLCMPLLHVVYTIPPYLTPLAPSLGRLFGGASVCALPSVHIRFKDNKPDSDGLDIMEKIVGKRFANWNQIFGNDQIKRLALSSGGDLRDFFRLIGDCLVKCSNEPTLSLPIGDKIIASAEDHLRRDMLPIAEEDLKWLRNIAQSKDPKLATIKDLPRLARFFDTTLVLNYRNSQDWYDVHPLLHTLMEEE